MDEQLKLFNQLPLLEVNTGKIITAESVKVEEINLPDFEYIPKNKYILHSTGGFHFFKDVPGALPIFQKQIWPWVEVLKETTNKTRKYSMAFRVMPRKGCYIEVTFVGLKNGVKLLKKISLHKLVCAAFKTNLNPKTHVVVNHINGSKVDYRVENVEWTTHKLNSVGPTLESRIPPEITYKIWEFSQMSVNKNLKKEEEEVVELRVSSNDKEIT